VSTVKLCCNIFLGIKKSVPTRKEKTPMYQTVTHS